MKETMKQRDSDTKWFADLHGGFEQALELIVKNYYKDLSFFAYRLIHNRDEAEDIVQESLVKLWNKKLDFDNMADIKSFLYVTTRHACFNYNNAQKRHQRSHVEIRYLSEQGEPEDVELEMLYAQTLREIYNQLSTLPTQCRTIFELLYFKKLTTAEIATQLGINKQTVLNQKTKAISLFRSGVLKKGLVLYFLFTLE